MNYEAILWNVHDFYSENLTDFKDDQNRTLSLESIW